MTWDQILEHWGIPTGVVISLLILVFFIRWVASGGESRLRRLANRILGDGGKHLGLLARVDQHSEMLSAFGKVQAQQGETLDAIKAQLEPDHGTSLLDIANETRTLVREQGRRLDEHLTAPHIHSHDA